MSNYQLRELVKKELERNPLLYEVDDRKGYYYQLEFIFESITHSWCDVSINNEGEVMINNSCVPKIEISPLINFKDRDVKYNRQLNSARWLIGAIKRREKILYDVAKIMIEAQKDFLDKGDKLLKPLTVREVAKRLNLHSSTVSRVTANKFIETDRGIFRLKDFFRRPVARMDDKNISSESLKEAIKELIDYGGSGAALKDCHVKDLLLKENGITVSRRTVAQYRKALGIPSYRKMTIDEKFVCLPK